MKNIKYPKINIAYNRFLDPVFIGYIQAQPQWKKWVVPSKLVVDSHIKMYQKECDKYGNKILKAMCQATGLAFERNQIDVHVVSGNPRPFSRPIVIKSRYTNVEFLNVITHELIHCLFVDNQHKRGFSVKYSHKDAIVCSHVVLYAVMNYIFLDVLKRPDMLNIPKISSDSNKTAISYSRAWDIMEKEGYKELIKKYFPKAK
jgi:hypothetical protein